jgi:predicted dehydrogenase
MSNREQYRAGIIGLGGIARAHTRGYDAVDAIVLVAGADVSSAQGAEYAREVHPIETYTDYVEMLDNEELDLVSVCTWPPLHEEMVVAAAQRGVKGIVCEKPMALNLGQADRMLQACERYGVKLVVGHQRRYNKRYIEAKAALNRGEIGELLEVYGVGGSDLLSDGSHTIDLIRYFVDDEPIQWVMGQIHRQVPDTMSREPRKVMVKGAPERYGHVVEHAALARFEFANGVKGLMEMGEIRPRVIRGVREDSALAPGAYQFMRLVGTEGRIEVYGDVARDPRPSGWRILRSSQAAWEEHPIEHDYNAFAREIEDLVRWIEEGGDHPLSGQSARADLEVLMAVFESSRRRGRVDFPLEVLEHPLMLMIESGEM